jgi:hypothetical protein
VIFSGITVAIGLLALVALPLPFLRSMGYGGLLIPLVSTLVAITLLPVVLAKLGPRLDWPHRRTDDKASRAWTRWAEGVARHRWLAAGAGMLVVLLLAFAATDLRLGNEDADTISRSGDARDGLVALEKAGIGEGSLLPHEVLVEGSANPDQVAAALRRVPGIHGAVAPSESSWRRDGTAVVDAVPIQDTSTDQGAAALDGVRDAAHAQGSAVRVGGQSAANDDFTDAVYGSFPLMIALIAITTFILLARAFRSLLLPVKAILLNILSVAAAWGVLVLVWHRRHGFDPVVDAVDDLRVPVRLVDGLRGVHPVPHAGGVRPHRFHVDRRHPGHRPHRPPGHERGADPVPRVHRDGVRAEHRREDDGHRPGRRHTARCHGGEGVDRARGDRTDGALELVAAGMAGEDPARRALASPARCSG